MNIIVLGINGMLGNYCYTYFKKYGPSTIGIGREIISCQMKDEEIYDKLRIYENRLYTLVNCIGLINRRKGEDNDFYTVNSMFPNRLYRICKKLNIDFIHVSTDCVFNGDIKTCKSYDEDSFHTSTDIYGISKSLGEGNFMTIRTSLIGEEINNKYSLIEYLKSMKYRSVDGFRNHFWNGITCLEYCKSIEYYIKNHIKWIGVRHIHSPETLTKYELCVLVSNTFGLNLKVNSCESAKYVNRSLSSIYEDEYKVQSIYIQLSELYSFSKILFGNISIYLISSCINPVDKRLDNFISRSVFSQKERLDQTLETIRSIRDRVSNSYCVLLESSVIDHETRDSISEKVDIFLDYSKDSLYRQMTEGYNKSIGEASTVLSGLQYIIQSDIKFLSISKISGRYSLDKDYTNDCSIDDIQYREFDNWYSTVLYTYGWNNRFVMMDTLIKCIYCLFTGTCNDIESSMRHILKYNTRVQLKRVMGVSGLVSVSGEYVHH